VCLDGARFSAWRPDDRLMRGGSGCSRASLADAAEAGESRARLLSSPQARDDHYAPAVGGSGRIVAGPNSPSLSVGGGKSSFGGGYWGSLPDFEPGPIFFWDRFRRLGDKDSRGGSVRAALARREAVAWSGSCRRQTIDRAIGFLDPVVHSCTDA
jgi:hypothetical protein